MFSVLSSRISKSAVVLIALLMASHWAAAQACPFIFWREDFEPPYYACGANPSVTPSCFAQHPFNTSGTSNNASQNVANYTSGQFSVLEQYCSARGCVTASVSNPDHDYLLAAQVGHVAYHSAQFSGDPAGYYIEKEVATIWAVNLPIDKTKSKLRITFNLDNLSADGRHLQLRFGFGNQVTQRSVAAHAGGSFSWEAPVDQLNPTETIFISMTADGVNTALSPQPPVVDLIGRVALDNVTLAYTDRAPGDVQRTVCGFGQQPVKAPQDLACNWYDMNGNRLASSVSTFMPSITQMQTQFQVATVDAGGCESERSTVTVKVVGANIFTENFNSTAGYPAGYPQGYVTQADGTLSPDGPINFSTDYTPVIVRYVSSATNPSWNRTNTNYPYYPGNIGPGKLTVAYDPYSYDPGWFKNPEQLATGGASGQLGSNRYLIVDPKVGSTPGSDVVWQRNLRVRAGTKYEIRFKMRNAYGTNSAYPNPRPPQVLLNGSVGVLVDPTAAYQPVQPFDLTPSLSAAWTNLTYLVDAPASGELPLAIATVRSTDDRGQDFLLDDIEVYELSAISMPEVANQALCGRGTVTLRSSTPGDLYWFTQYPGPGDQPVARGQEVQLNAASLGTNYFYVQNRVDPSCPSLVKTVQVYVYEPNPTFAVDPQPNAAQPVAANFAVRFTATGSQTATTRYTWNWGDGQGEQTTTEREVYYRFAKAGTYRVRLTVEETYTSSTYPTITCRKTSTETLVYVFAPLCEVIIPLGGSFQKEQRTGAVTYLSANDCAPAAAFECVSEQGLRQANVVAASMTAFTDTLVLAEATYGATANPLLFNQRRQQPYATYTYQAPVTTGLNLQAGTFTMGYFNWYGSARSRPQAWLAPSFVTRLSPNAQVLEERDALNVPSTAKFGYGTLGGSVGTTTVGSAFAVPYLQAQNAEYATVLFEGFETISATQSQGDYAGSDGLVLRRGEVAQVTTTASPGVRMHTGNQAIQLQPVAAGQWQLTLKALPYTAQLQRSGISLKVWVQTSGITLDPVLTKVNLYTSDGATLRASGSLQRVAGSGDWSLYEAVIPAGSTSASLNEQLLPRLQFGGIVAGTPVVIVDDVRLQPRDAQMVAYVYDPVSLKLLASFDDQHFAVLYQYNAEGKLIRKQVETERGVKTLQETYYHTPLVNPPTSSQYMP